MKTTHLKFSSPIRLDEDQLVGGIILIEEWTPVKGTQLTREGGRYLRRRGGRGEIKKRKKKHPDE